MKKKFKHKFIIALAIVAVTTALSRLMTINNPFASILAKTEKISATAKIDRDSVALIYLEFDKINTQ